ncbi:hypothetical protein GCM10022243_48090 [Saccharothrix violaceirubra]|uniref:Uncharacterized protein n=1 Tax=Saccharothrix violaceirubra TaxID=413306 RepID=A0A7W7SZI8_9PSEU|nr:hypothetical protein [Saccharothrix violaceirubra]MBB4963849.1 hypothetical protein [Saccharothrix violaceirubra]
MGWASDAYGLAPWAGGYIPNVLPPGWTPVPPPVPGATTVYTVAAPTGTGPWGVRTWGGAMPSVASLPGGVSVAPDPEAGVVRVWAWWPDAATLQLVRVGEDGVRTPVRGAYGLTVTEQTRRNLVPNPSMEAGLNGYLPVDGNTTLSSVVDPVWAAAGTVALRMASTTTTTGVVVPGTLPGTGGYTLALNLGLTAVPSTVTVTVAWLNAAGTSAGTTTLTATADQIAASVNRTNRLVWTFSAPGTAVTGAATLTITGLTVGQYAHLDAVVAERGTTAGDYYDGDTLGGLWTGTAELSTSVLSPVRQIVDGECPLDVPVRYEVASPAIIGGRATSTPVILESGDRTWLTHPEYPESPVQAHATATPTRDHVLRQALHPILDSPYPVAVSAAQRSAPGGEIQLVTSTFEKRDQALALLGSGTPVLWRTPAGFGDGDGQWITLGTVVEDPVGQKGWGSVRLLTAPYQVVEAPADVLVA